MDGDAPQCFDVFNAWRPESLPLYQTLELAPRARNYDL